MNTVCINGSFLSADEAHVSIRDRCFMYGDGLFETLPVKQAIPIFWDDHWARLTHGAGLLGIAIPAPEQQVRIWAHELIIRNAPSDAVLRIQLSRGPSARGYSTRNATQPILVLSLSELAPSPQSWRLMVAAVRAPPGDMLSRVKTCNRLHQILARKEAEESGFDEALMLNHFGQVTECAAANIFWIKSQTIVTPAVETGALPGITREKVLEICRTMRIQTFEVAAQRQELDSVDSAFVTLSTFGIVPIAEFMGKTLQIPPIIRELQNLYDQSVEREILRRFPK